MGLKRIRRIQMIKKIFLSIIGELMDPGAVNNGV